MHINDNQFQKFVKKAGKWCTDIATRLRGRGYGRLDSRIRRRKQWLMFGVGVVAFFILASIVVRASDPDDGWRYRLKTEVCEPTMSHLRFSASSKAAYQLKLMERRVQELEQFNQNHTTIDERARERLGNLLATEFDALKQIIETDDTIPARQTVTILHKLTTQLYLQELLISRNENLADLEDVANDRLREAEDVYEGFVLAYSGSSTQTELQSFINDQFRELLYRIDKQASDEETLEKINKRLGKIQESITSDDAAEAIYLVHESLQLLETAKYFDEQ